MHTPDHTPRAEISLLSIASKFHTGVLLYGLPSARESCTLENQAGFRPDRSVLITYLTFNQSQDFTNSIFTIGVENK